MYRPLLLILLLLLCMGCDKSDPCGTTTEERWIDFAEEQLQTAFLSIDEALRISPQENGQPYIAPRSLREDGSLRMATLQDWTSGFFPGSLWLLYENTGKKQWLEAAMRYTEKMEESQYITNTHDIGFLMMCSFGNGFRLTDNAHYRDALLQGARSLASRYSDATGCIRSWDFNTAQWQYPVIIDNLMNLELLFLASQISGEERWRQIAMNHADKTLQNHFRPDYSSYHVVDYDASTGEVRWRGTYQGYSDQSAWARGQSWGLYGYTMCYRYTRQKRYLEQAKHIADFLFTQPAMDHIPYWDYNDPQIPGAPIDASAAMIMCSALYELSTFVPEKKAFYKEKADQILESAANHLRSPLGQNKGFLLLHSVGSKPAGSEVDVPVSYADYYLLEAITRKKRSER